MIVFPSAIWGAGKQPAFLEENMPARRTRKPKHEAKAEVKEESAGFGLTFRTEAELNAAIARLNDEKTQLDALEQLISFSSYRLFQVGSVFFLADSREKDAWIEKAVKAVNRTRNFEVIRLCLNSEKRMLLLFGFWNTPNENFGTKEEWQTLVPRLRELAIGADAGWRYHAQKCLGRFAGQDEFLAKCLENETDLGNIMQLVQSRLPASEFDNQMNAYVLRFLADKDEKVRCEALGFISSTWNPSQAEIYRVKFSGEIFARVLELSRSTSTKERAAAVYALEGFGPLIREINWPSESEKVHAIHEWRQQNAETVRKRMFELARDESEEVRRRVAFAVGNQKEREDVQTVLKKLLQDKSASVRYSTILMLGCKNYIKELKEIAAGSDKETAKYAAERLKAIEREKP